MQSNGAVTVKSLSGGSYSATGNPSGAVAKANQNAATQPPTVVIQATSGPIFNWTTDCYILKFDTYTGQANSYAFGAGKYNATANTFTGILGSAVASGSATGTYILSMMTGMAVGGSTNIQTVNCGNNVACAYTPSFPSSAGTQLTVVQNLSTSLIPVTKCYP